MVRMEYIRPFDPDKAFETGSPGYRAQFLSHLESAIFINSHIEEGGCGPGLHYHRSDQLYYLIRGSMNVQLGDAVHKVEAGSLVFIPAGLPHRNWNDGPGAETHFEMIIPATAPMAPIAIMVDSADEIPGGLRSTHPGYVRKVDGGAMTEPLPGLRVMPLADPESGSHHTVVNYIEVAPGSAGPGTHIHRFDQYYLVLEGELTVEIALETYTVGPDQLVILPAGVPHRQYNAGEVTERHVAILAPAPAPRQPWDLGVQISRTGEDHLGPSAIPDAPPADLPSATKPEGGES